MAKEERRCGYQEGNAGKRGMGKLVILEGIRKQKKVQKDVTNRTVKRWEGGTSVGLGISEGEESGRALEPLRGNRESELHRLRHRGQRCKKKGRVAATWSRDGKEKIRS